MKSLKMFLALFVVSCTCTNAHADTYTLSWPWTLIVTAARFDYRITKDSSTIFCTGGTRGSFAYLRPADENSKEKYAALLTAYITKSTVQLTTTKDVEGYCHIDGVIM